MTSRPSPPVPEPAAIILVDDGRILGGGQLFALRLARWLLEQGGEHPAPTIACPTDSELAARAREAGIPVRDIRFPDPAIGALHLAPAAVARAATVLREARDSGAIVVANAPRAQAFLALARTLVRHPPAIVNLEHERDTAGRSSARLVLRRAGRVVAVGANTAAAYEAALPGTRVRHINNFLAPEEIERAAASSADRTAARRRSSASWRGSFPRRG